MEALTRRRPVKRIIGIRRRRRHKNDVTLTTGVRCGLGMVQVHKMDGARNQGRVQVGDIGGREM